MIPRSIETRTAEAVWAFMRSDQDYFALFRGVGEEGQPGYVEPRIYMGSFFEQSTIPISPRQAHIYPGDQVKKAGTGAAWDSEFDMHIEYFFPRLELPAERGSLHPRDEVKELANRLYTGQSPSPGRFFDPDNPGKFIVTGIASIRITQPVVVADAAVMRLLVIDFQTREDAQGRRI